ncbi:TetR/AcrR family transcriptional regulator [Actinomadura roseirufa]|uniref:TetR/AcrR family transcriptional regulator n=1 Tax=Actinomadura roseirufa TaxID=2094049 RepID=UPI002414D661|nr:TetR family transcriptional regulator [Actinomadura roseirufa]
MTPPARHRDRNARAGDGTGKDETEPDAAETTEEDRTARNGTAGNGTLGDGTVRNGTAGGTVEDGTARGGGAARGPGRRPGPTETREEILAAARDLFAEKGYDGASLRAIARAAGVDPALVHHFFGNKEGVFVAAMRFPVEPSVLLPQLLALPRDEVGEAMVRMFLAVWGDAGRRAPVLAMLRSAMTNDRAASLMSEFLTSALFKRAGLARDVPMLRIQAAAGQMMGVMILRYVLRVEPMASASEDELVALVAPTLQHYLT